MPASYAVIANTIDDVTNNTADFTSSGFGTPTAAILFCNSTAITENPINHARMSIGFWDSTNQASSGIANLDNRATALCVKASNDSYGLMVCWTTSILTTFTVSNITDGIRLTVAAGNYSVDLYVVVVLLKGINAKLLTFTPNSTQNGTQESASLGFAPKLLLFSSIASTTADLAATNSDNYIAFGAAGKNGVSRNFRWWSDQSAADQANAIKFDEDRCVGDENSWALEITTWGSDTFTATTRDAATGGVVTFCLALGGDDLLYDMGTITTRTTTGTTEIATTNKPDTALVCVTCAAGTTRATNSEANGFMIGAGKGTSQYSFNASSEDGAATMNTNVVYKNNQILNLDSSASGARTDLCDATSEFNNSGMVLTYSAVDTTERKGWYLIFGQPYIVPIVSNHYRMRRI